MKEQTAQFNVLAEKPVGRLLLQYALPAIVAMAAASVYNIIDGIFIGQGVGPEAIMGLALTGPLMSLTAAFGAMVGVGAATLMSVKLGQKDYTTAQSILGNVLIMNFVLGLVLGGTLLLFIDPILRFFGASDTTLPYSRDFMSVILLGNVITHIYLGLNAMLRSTNRPQKAMLSTIGTVVLNCCFAPLFIFVFDWGISGAAFATILAQFVMLMWQLKLFSNKADLIHLNRRIMRFKPQIVKESLIVGLPQFLINLCACLVAAMMTRSLTTYGGDTAVGAFGIANRLLLFIVMVVIGLNQAMQPIAGYNFGAKRYDRVISVLKRTLVVGTGITLTGFITGTLFCHSLCSLVCQGFARTHRNVGPRTELHGYDVSYRRFANCVDGVFPEHRLCWQKYFSFAHASADFPGSGHIHFASRFQRSARRLVACRPCGRWVGFDSGYHAAH